MSAYSARRIASNNHVPMFSSDPTVILSALREHMTGIVWEYDDMTIREARLWVSLLTTSNGTPVTPKAARGRGFYWMFSRAEVWTAVRVLTRFQRIARSITKEN